MKEYLQSDGEVLEWNIRREEEEVKAKLEKKGQINSSSKVGWGSRK